MASELSSKTLDDISNKIADDIAYAFYQQCIQEKLTVKQSEDLMFLLCSFPESKHHDLHTLGECLLDSFFRQFVYHFCMNPSKEAVQKARQSTVDLMRERFRMSFANITPAMMDYMEGVLDPELFPHNLPVLFAGGVPVRRLLEVFKREILGRMNKKRATQLNRVQSLLRSLNQAQLELVAKTNQSIHLQCQGWPSTMVTQLLTSNAMSPVLALHVHGQLCLECAVSNGKNPLTVFSEITTLLHMENEFRTKHIMPVVERIISQYNLSIDITTFRF